MNVPDILGTTPFRSATGRERMSDEGHVRTDDSDSEDAEGDEPSLLDTVPLPWLLVLCTAAVRPLGAGA